MRKEFDLSLRDERVSLIKVVKEGVRNDRQKKGQL